MKKIMLCGALLAVSLSAQAAELTSYAQVEDTLFDGGSIRVVIDFERCDYVATDEKPFAHKHSGAERLRAILRSPGGKSAFVNFRPRSTMTIKGDSIRMSSHFFSTKDWHTGSQHLIERFAKSVIYAKDDTLEVTMSSFDAQTKAPMDALPYVIRCKLGESAHVYSRSKIVWAQDQK